MTLSDYDRSQRPTRLDRARLDDILDDPVTQIAEPVERAVVSRRPSSQVPMAAEPTRRLAPSV